jgi:predicted nucleic acid-binding protein
LTHEIFKWLESSRNAAVTSAITMLEVLVQPYRDDDDERIDSFYALLSTFPHLSWIDLNLEIVDRAAQLRAKYKLKTPDAIQVATAIVSGSTGFISNDEVFRRIPALDLMILDNLLDSRL